jgi:hypothetical protein
MPNMFSDNMDLFSHLVVLTDITYWCSHFDQLEAWAEEYKAKMEGMTVFLPDEQAAIVFKLRWA